MRRRSWALLGLGALLAHVGLPYLLVQVGNLGVVRRGRGAGAEVALTFDDGPDPATTPRVLDALREAGVKATFFMPGEALRAFPDLARRVADEGHEVAAHGLAHRHAWFRSPLAPLSDTPGSLARLKTVTGRDARFFRPPHGAYTLAGVLALRASGALGAHWTVEAHDWHPGHSPEDVRARVLAHVVPGAVIVMHDAGVGGATTAEALPALLADLKARGYVPVPLGDLPEARPERPRDLLVRLFQALDAAFDRQNRIERVGQRAWSLLRAGRAPFPLEGSPLAEHGESLLEIHVDSDRVVRLAENPLRGLRLVRDSMKDLALALEEREEWRDVRGVFSIGPFSGIMAGLGFTVEDVPPDMRRRLTVWSDVLRRVYGSTDREAREARMAFITREELLRRYGKKG